MKTKVYVGMSGGVDSSLSAALLVDQGYDVTGVYMKNWTRNIPGFICPWEKDYFDAKKVAYQLGIPFKVFDLQTEYYASVVEYMLKAFQEGLTPNPDIMCNQEIKFKLFLDLCLEDGVDMIATGHYAITKNGRLYKGQDESKDQSYFLYRVSETALKQTLFPVGEMKKSQVRKLAHEKKLFTADKKDSQGICFVGEVGIKNFIISELGPQEPGQIIDKNGQLVGYHDGAIFYTIGQRHGLNIGGGLPYYVTSKDMATNTVYVTRDLNDQKLWSSAINLANPWWINELPSEELEYNLKCRYRSSEVKIHLRFLKNKKNVKLSLLDQIKAASPGQSAVIYLKNRVVGGGIII